MANSVPICQINEAGSRSNIKHTQFSEKIHAYLFGEWIFPPYYILSHLNYFSLSKYCQCWGKHRFLT